MMLYLEIYSHVSAYSGYVLWKKTVGIKGEGGVSEMSAYCNDFG
jgi:hypothetical protein